MNRYAVIVAGGSGSRMGVGIPKQFRCLKGKPLLWWSLDAFHKENATTGLIVVLPEQFIDLWKDLFSALPNEEQYEHLITIGGESRTQSVVNGLKLIADFNSLVAVHDAARPLVTPDLISRGWNVAIKDGAGVPVIPVTDSLRELDSAGNNSKSVDRSRYVAVQTPQVFQTEILKGAYEKSNDSNFTDDATVVENFGLKITLFEGSYRNIKVTNPSDIEIATILMDKYA